MPTTIQSTATLQLIPLFDIQHEDVVHAYREGLHHQSHAGNRPLAVRYLVHCIQAAMENKWFDKRHDAYLRRFIGFIIGEIHGKVLTASGVLRPDVTTLVTLNNCDDQRGYRAGRLWFFYEATSDERTFTEDQLLRRLREDVTDSLAWNDPESVWNYTTACLLGELSGHLFPLTDQERQQWQEEEDAYARESEQLSQGQDTEPVTSAPIIEFVA